MQVLFYTNPIGRLYNKHCRGKQYYIQILQKGYITTIRGIKTIIILSVYHLKSEIDIIIVCMNNQINMKKSQGTKRFSQQQDLYSGILQASCFDLRKRNSCTHRKNLCKKNYCEQKHLQVYFRVVILANRGIRIPLLDTYFYSRV